MHTYLYIILLYIIIKGSEDLCIRGWDTRMSAKQPVLHINAFIYFPLCMDISIDNNYIVTGCKGFDSNGCEVKVWDIRTTNQNINTFLGHSQDVKYCSYINKSKDYIFSLSKDGTCGIWNIPQNKKIAWYNLQKTQYTSCVLRNINEKGQIPFAITAFDGSVTFGNIDYNRLISSTSSTDSKNSTNTLIEDIISIESSTAAHISSDTVIENNNS